jgi:hypothetical protein
MRSINSFILTESDRIGCNNNLSNCLFLLLASAGSLYRYLLAWISTAGNSLNRASEAARSQCLWAARFLEIHAPIPLG